MSNGAAIEFMSRIKLICKTVLSLIAGIAGHTECLILQPIGCV